MRGAAPIRDADGRVAGAVLVEGNTPGQALERLQEIAAGFEEYRQLQLLRAPIKISYILPLLMVALLVVFAATWFGFYLARSITGPIQELAQATQRVAGGDLDFQLEVASRDEVGTLMESFNRMTRDLRTSKAQVETAQDTLRAANEELERRRRYMEIVLGRVTAGVVGADREGRITTWNAAAAEMLELDASAFGKSYRDILQPEAEQLLRELLDELNASRQDAIQKEVVLTLKGMRRTMLIHLTRLRDEAGERLGTVAVFDDLTELVKAQRAQAWREVARRIAHEIKNPLTPIQLSAQRLRRRYPALLEGAEEGGVFDEATRTIIAQVEGLKHLVNEFSRFAKMPEARPAPEDFNRLVEEVVRLFRAAHPEIAFSVELDATLPRLDVDAEQVKRALINLLDNAVAAVEGSGDRAVEICTRHDPAGQRLLLTVSDNGVGLSAEVKERLFEPYFSTKKGGTGLGLAIVKSIVQDHGGSIRVGEQERRGTRFLVELPLRGAG
ncbi:MAG: HAMP domain-containing protein, partial [Deltaproteobacteria bacterium]|nr:HAMP domain-containing protein [Deltaproteobacteria bacterium]